MQTWLFWLLAAASVVAALLVVAERRVVRAVLLLTGLLAAVAGLYLLLAAPLLALVQLTLFAGALLAVYLPVTLFLDLPDDADRGPDVGPGGGTRRFGVMLSVVLLVELAWAFQRLRPADLPEAGTGGSPAMADVPLTGSGVAVVVLLALVAAAGTVVFVRREMR